MRLGQAFAVAVLLISVHARAGEQTLLAMNPAMHASRVGYEYGRLFDGRARHLTVPQLPEVVAVPPLPPQQVVAEAPKWHRRVRYPFILPVPAPPPSEYSRTFRRLRFSKWTSAYDRLILGNARRLGIDARLIKAVIAAESEFVAKAVSPAGALGLMQIMPATAEYMGVSGRKLFDPAYNIRAGSNYLHYLLRRAWRMYNLQGVPYQKAPEWLLQRVIAAYNAGPRFLRHQRLYRETRDYVVKVMMYHRDSVSDVGGR